MIDLDDEEAFMAALGGKMAEQAEAGIIVGGEDAEPQHNGITVKLKPFLEQGPEPVPYEKPPLTKRLGAVDLETDPFLEQRRPVPFAAGLALDDGRYFKFWGDDCVEQLFDKIEYLKQELWEESREEYCFYAHNGGKFDFHFFMNYLDDDCEPFLIDKRLVKIMYQGVEFRDSYSLIPVALKKLQSAKHKKLEIEYWKMERLFREEHKEEILTYLEEDCFTLLDNVRDFIERFGWRLTIASTALPMLQSFHGFNAIESVEDDAKLREFYKGGRVQCFQTGLITGDFVMVDANSMYPAAMKNFEHPVGSFVMNCRDLDDCDFAYVQATNNGCLGVGSGLDFDFSQTRGKFFATIHEIKAGIETGTLKVEKLIKGYRFQHKTNFGDFVDHFYNLRLDARLAQDLAGVEFYKLIMNSAYGKFAQHTGRYKDYKFNVSQPPSPVQGDKLEFIEVKQPDGSVKKKCVVSPNGWRPEISNETFNVWSRPKPGAGTRFLNVATAASITGAARAVLWKAICAAEEPLYCDTDSIICRRFNGDLDEKRLGAWKVEATGNAVLIAGKKMYAFLSTTPKVGAEQLSIDGVSYWLIKKAHKGVQLRAEQILEIVRGGVVEYENPSPAFTLSREAKFTKRRVRMTGNALKQMELDLNGEEISPRQNLDQTANGKSQASRRGLGKEIRVF
jgi:hypothetical protein